MLMVLTLMAYMYCKLEHYLQIIDLNSDHHGRILQIFGCLPDNSHFLGDRLTKEGLPHIGTYLQRGDPFYRYCYCC